MFRRLLIANRGEIACRLIRACSSLGIESVAVYASPDAGARHVRLADRCESLGAAGGYLDADRLLEAARRSGAEAVHPGYGFLSENAAFAERVEAAGMVFVGPPPSAIAAMGDKIAARELAVRAGVNVIPGSGQAIADLEQARAVARELGWPLMIKAAAGGGGKGMRIARREDELEAALTRAAEEAESGFGDGRVFLEKYIEAPRHIEIQILSDRHGNHRHFGERECSVQRRHQKVIEEAPSPFLDAATRKAMGEQACALARAVGCHSAVTVEFVVDGARNFYFLEMNTRLQVEHPVTEEVYGVDLAAWMIRIAAGEVLDIAQEAIAARGHAIEARLYAEDPQRDFAPLAGLIERWEPPPGAVEEASGAAIVEPVGLRLDSGFEAGDRASIHYDPMLAKLIAKGPDRAAALAALRAGLDDFEMRGVCGNRDFLAAILRHPVFVDGAATTHFIEEAWPDGFAMAAPTGDEATIFVAVAMGLAALRERRRRGAARPAPDDEVWGAAIDGEVVSRRLKFNDAAGRPSFAVEGDGTRIELAFMSSPQAETIAVAVASERETRRFRVAWSGARAMLTHSGLCLSALIAPPHTIALSQRLPPRRASGRSDIVHAPLPGRLHALAVKVGDKVAPGDDLAIVEAMKMFNALRSPRHGEIASIFVQEGDILAMGDKILSFVAQD